MKRSDNGDSKSGLNLGLKTHFSFDLLSKFQHTAVWYVLDSVVWDAKS